MEVRPTKSLDSLEDTIAKVKRLKFPRDKSGGEAPIHVIGLMEVLLHTNKYTQESEFASARSPSSRSSMDILVFWWPIHILHTVYHPNTNLNFIQFGPGRKVKCVSFVEQDLITLAREVDTSPNRNYSNLNKQEREILKSLKENRNTVTKKADKEGVVIIFNTIGSKRCTPATVGLRCI